MNADELINQHLRWKGLIEALFHEDEQNIGNATDLFKVKTCELGKWIHAIPDSDILLKNQTFQEVREIHKEFHRLGEEIIMNYQSGNGRYAKALMPLFSQYSACLIAMLRSLSNEIGRSEYFVEHNNTPL